MVPVSLVIDIEFATGILPAAGTQLHLVPGPTRATGRTWRRFLKQTTMGMITVHTRTVSAPPEQVARSIAGFSDR